VNRNHDNLERHSLLGFLGTFLVNFKIPYYWEVGFEGTGKNKG
jgi:hypothetical protein